MLTELEERVGQFSVIFLPESDAHLNAEFSLEFDKHLLLRKWPGEGCFAYSILVHRLWAPHLVNIKHEGRAARLTFRDARRKLFDVIFVHGAHGDDSLYSVFDMAHLHRSRPRKRPCMIMGDFNIDLLPSLAADPFWDSPNRAAKHLEQRQQLEAFLSGCGMEIHLRQPSMGTRHQNGI